MAVKIMKIPQDYLSEMELNLTAVSICVLSNCSEDP